MSDSHRTPGKLGSGPRSATLSGPRHALSVPSRIPGANAAKARSGTAHPQAVISPPVLAAVKRPVDVPAPVVRRVVPAQGLIDVRAASPKPAKRRVGRGISLKLLVSVAGAVAILLAVLALFIPSQVLVIVLLCALATTLAGIFCAGISRAIRVCACVAGIACLALTGLGLRSVQQRRDAQALLASERADHAAVEDDLKHNCYFEATRRIAAIKASQAPYAQDHLNALHAQTETWLKANFGELNPDERQTLFNLWQQFGSLAAARYKHFRAIRLDGGRLELSVTTDCKFASRQRTIGASQLLEHLEPLIRVLLQRHEITRINLHIFSADEDANSCELATIALTDEATGELRAGKWGTLRNAIEFAKAK